MKTPLAATAAVMLLALAGCGGTAQPEAAPAGGGDAGAQEAAQTQEAEPSPPGGPGDYHTSIDGAVLTFTLPGSPDASDLATDINTYRAKADLEPVDFVSINIDNMDGESEIGVSSITVVTDAGDQFTLESYIDEPITEAQDVIGDDTDLYNEGVDLTNETLSDDLKPGAKGTVLLYGTDEIDSITGVYVTTYLGEYPAVPTSVPIEETMIDPY